jgi:hypothetical protein
LQISLPVQQLPKQQLSNTAWSIPNSFFALQEARKLLHNVPVVNKDWVEACMQRLKQVRPQASKSWQDSIVTASNSSSNSSSGGRKQSCRASPASPAHRPLTWWLWGSHPSVTRRN